MALTFLDPNMVSAVATSISAVVAALALIGLTVQIYLLKKQLLQDIDWKRKEKALLFSPVYHAKVEAALQNVVTKLEKLKLRDRDDAVPLNELNEVMAEDPTSYSDMQTVLVYLESVGLAVDHNVADFQIIYDILGTEIIHFCVVFSEYIKRERKGNPRVWKNIDYLNNRFLQERDRLLSKTTKEHTLAEPNSGPTVADLFRRAQAIRNENAQTSYKDLSTQLVREFSGGPFPPTYNLTIPEQDARAPQEDWSAGLPLVLRGIQQKDWNGIAQGIVLSLEQVENYEHQRESEGTRDKWHDRSKGIAGATAKGVSKWMPEELIKLAEKNVKNR